MKKSHLQAKSEEVRATRKRIASEASDAADHFYLLNGLDESRCGEYYLEMNEAFRYQQAGDRPCGHT